VIGSRVALASNDFRASRCCRGGGGGGGPALLSPLMRAAVAKGGRHADGAGAAHCGTHRRISGLGWGVFLSAVPNYQKDKKVT